MVALFVFTLRSFPLTTTPDRYVPKCGLHPAGAVPAQQGNSIQKNHGKALMYDVAQLLNSQKGA